MHAMAVDTGGHVFVVQGSMDQAGVPLVERWTGTTWKPVPDTSSGGYAYINHIAPDSSGNMYACGIFGASNGVARYNGEGWTTIPIPSNGYTINSHQQPGDRQKRQSLYFRILCSEWRISNEYG